MQSISHCSLTKRRLPGWFRRLIHSTKTALGPWFQRLAKVTFDVLTPLVNLIAPDRGRAKSSLMNKTILRECFLMSVPTYPNIRFTATDGSTRVPEHFPVR